MQIKGTKKAVSKEFLEQFEAATVGTKLQLPSIFPELGDETTMAFCMEKEKNFAQFALYWMGIHCGDVSAEIHSGEIIFAEL